MKDLIKRNYNSTIKRGKISNSTTHKDFNDKINEELTELNHEIHSERIYYESAENEVMSKKTAIECTDIILTCLNYLCHSGYDPIKLMEEKILINEKRED